MTTESPSTNTLNHSAVSDTATRRDGISDAAASTRQKDMRQNTPNAEQDSDKSHKVETKSDKHKNASRPGAELILQAAQNLDKATFWAPYAGLYGASPALCYRAMRADALSATGRHAAWNCLIASAQKSRNAAVLARALFDAQKSCADADNSDRRANENAWSDLMMIQGHLLRRIAKDCAESARSYAKASRSSRFFALSGNIALMRLYRADPLCEETQKALQDIRDAKLLRFDSKSDVEKRLARISPDDSEKRALTKIDLAAAILLEWGDVATALEWLEDAKPSPQSPARHALIGIANAIARACLDQRPTVARAVRVLDAVGADLEIANIALLTLCIQMHPSHKDDLDFIFARTCATQLNRYDLACLFLHKAVLGLMSKTPSRDWMAAWMTQTWIFECAKHQPQFADALLRFADDIDDESAILYLLENLQNALSGTHKTVCGVMRIQHLAAAGHYQEALKLFDATVKNANLKHRSEQSILFDSFADLFQDPSREKFSARFALTAQTFRAAAQNTPAAGAIDAMISDTAGGKKPSDNRRNTLDIHGLVGELCQNPAPYGLVPLSDDDAPPPMPQNDSFGGDIFGDADFSGISGLFFDSADLKRFSGGATDGSENDADFSPSAATPMPMHLRTQNALRPALGIDDPNETSKPRLPKISSDRSGGFKPPGLQTDDPGFAAGRQSDDAREAAFRRAIAAAVQNDWNAACAIFFDQCADLAMCDDTIAKCADLTDLMLQSAPKFPDCEPIPKASPWYPDAPRRNSVTALTVALFVDPKQQCNPWFEWIARQAANDENLWSQALRTWLLLLAHYPNGDSRVSLLAALAKKQPNPRKSARFFIPCADIVLQNEALFEQVLMMSDAMNQRQMLEKLDDAIAMYEGDAVQKNALIAKKYRIADLLGDERIKLTCLKDILETAPDDHFATEQLQKIDPNQLKPHAQILYYQLLIYIDADSDMRLRHQMMLASIYAKSSQFNNAINLYDAIADEHPDCLEARYQILNLLESLENWKSAENALLALINIEPSQSMRVQCLIRLADIQNIHMRMPMRALLTLFAAIDADPEKISLLHGKMCEICDQSKSFAALLDKYEDLAAHAKSYEVRRIAVVLLANICAERINKPILACNILDDFFEREGKNDSEFLKVTANFYAEVKHWESYCKVASALLQIAGNSEEKAGIALSIADIQENKLRDFQRAAQYARLAAQAGSIQPDVWQDIAHYLLRADAPQDAVDALNQAEKLETNPDKKIAILFETTRLNTQIGKLRDAVAAFSRLTALRPPLENLTPIAEDLIALAAARKDRDAFVALCGDLVNACPKIEQPALLLQQALTLIRVFGDVAAARSILAANKNNFDNIDSEQAIILAEILTKLGENKAAVDTIQNALGYFALSESNTLSFLQFLLENAVTLNDSELIKSTAEKILAIDPDDPSANFNAIHLAYRMGLWDDAAERIQHFLPRLDSLSPDDATELHYEYGVILHAAQNSELAIECLDNALRIRADFKPAVDLKLTIILEHQRWPEALPLFRLLLTLSDDPEEQGAIRKRIAEVYHFYLHQNAEAIHNYEIALSLGGDVEDVPMRLLELYIQTQDWQKAAMTAQILAMAQTDSAFAKASYLTILADIRANHLGNVSDATNALLEAFVLEPVCLDIVRPLTQLLLRQSDIGNIKAMIDNIVKHLGNHEKQPNSDETTAQGAQNALLSMKKTFEIQSQNSNDDCPENALQYINNILQTYHIVCSDADTTDPADNADSVKSPQIPPLPPLTVDSSLFKNPEFLHHPSADPIPQTPPAPQTKDKLDADAQKSGRPAANGEKQPSDSAPKTQNNNADNAGRPKTSAVINSLVAPIPSFSGQTKSTLQAIENLAFTDETIADLYEQAKSAQASFSMICLADILDICAKPRDDIRPRPLPKSIPVIVRQNLFSQQCQAAAPSLLKLIRALAADGFPLTAQEIGADGDENAQNNDEIPQDARDCHARIAELLDAPKTRLCQTRENSLKYVLTNTQPAAILCPTHKIHSHSAWVAYLAFALSLARPESRLVATFAPPQIHRMLSQCADVMSILRAKQSDLPPETQAEIKTALNQAGLTAATMPRITQDTLAVIHQIAAFRRSVAIQNALLFSQSLLDCLQILADAEGLRFPTSLPSLKSAMKQSNSIRELVKFALSPSAQKTYNRIFA